MSFGERVRSYRQSVDISQKELAEKIGVTQNLLSLYERDRVQPTVERIEWICKALEITATELLGF